VTSGEWLRNSRECWGVSSHKVLKKLRSKRSFVWIDRHISDKRKGKVIKWKEEGIWLVREMRRTYPHAELGSHLLGSVDIDARGLEGAELRFDSRLKGSVSSFKALRDARGRPTLIDAQDADGFRNGASVQLTLDSVLQNEVEAHLAASIEATGSKSGSVIVMDADNGDLLSVANWPTFDPNRRGHQAERRRNRAFTDVYEPGSTFKALTLAAAVEKGWQLNDRLHGEKGIFRIGGRTVGEAHDGFEWMNLAQMIQKSSNVVAAKLALELGRPLFMGFLRSFELNRKTGSGFPGEATGWLPGRSSSVSELALANIGFGQGITVTPDSNDSSLCCLCQWGSARPSSSND
jgi:cell division protein FtsI (penicillin-binding protein 3)